jgi:hypothetical protein
MKNLMNPIFRVMSDTNGEVEQTVQLLSKTTEIICIFSRICG